MAFGAYGEMLHIADLLNDGDTFYVWVNGHGPYFAPGASKSWDLKTYNLSDIPEGYRVAIAITDDKAGNDLIARNSDDFPYPNA